MERIRRAKKSDEHWERDQKRETSICSYEGYEHITFLWLFIAVVKGREVQDDKM